jgi:hypothetical protein
VKLGRRGGSGNGRDQRTTRAARTDATLVGRRGHTCCWLGVVRFAVINIYASVFAVEE